MCLEPRDFSTALDWALRGSNNVAQEVGIGFGGWRLPNLRDISLANEIVLFANLGSGAAQLFDGALLQFGGID